MTSQSTNNYPADDDGQALARLAESGIDMSTELVFEFSLLVKNEDEAKAVTKALQVNKIGQKYETDYDEGELEEGEEMTEENSEFWPSWTVYVIVSMLPKYEEVVAFQNSLREVCSKDGGSLDGWGVSV